MAETTEDKSKPLWAVCEDCRAAFEALRSRIETKCACEFAPQAAEIEDAPDTIVEWCAFHADLRDSEEAHRQQWARADKRAGAIARAAQANSWLPIDTAPKDGTEILIWRAGWACAYVAKWHRGCEDEPDGWLLDPLAVGPGEDETFLGYAEDIHSGCMPTHWAPVPETAP